MRCKQIIVKGDVQGVYFRASTREKAEKLGIKGEVRNLPDGSVEVIACGSAESLEELISWCRVGPPMAEVEEVIVNDVEAKVFEGFRIVRGR